MFSEIRRATTAIIKNIRLESCRAAFNPSSWDRAPATIVEAAHPIDFHIAYPPKARPIFL